MFQSPKLLPLLWPYYLARWNLHQSPEFCSLQRRDVQHNLLWSTAIYVQYHNAKGETTEQEGRDVAECQVREMHLFLSSRSFPQQIASSADGGYLPTHYKVLELTPYFSLSLYSPPGLLPAPARRLCLFTPNVHPSFHPTNTDDLSACLSQQVYVRLPMNAIHINQKKKKKKKK